MAKEVKKKEEEKVENQEMLFGAIPKKYLIDRYNKLITENKPLLEEIAMLNQALQTEVKMNVVDETKPTPE
jgi:anthranilate/para-aminobenzoate synthase component II